MTWGAPLAWIGLAALAVPLLVHLLARRVTTRVAFPTLRFIDPSRLTPTRRRRFSDPWLLVIRCAIVGLAVAALAQPWLTTAARDAEAATRVIRAIVVDTSDSMRAPTADGRAGLDAARAEAESLGEGADAAGVFESADAAAGLRSAAAWLVSHGGTREIIVISDFQRGALDDANVLAVDESIGLRFVPVAVDPPGGEPLEFNRGDLRTTVTATGDDDLTAVRWQTQPGDTPAERVNVVTTETDALPAEALRRETRRWTLPTDAIGGPTTVVLPDAEDRSAFVAAAGSIDEAWMFDAVEAIRRDPAVTDATRSPADDGESTSATATPNAHMVPVVTAPGGRVLARAGATDADGTSRLLLALEVGLDHPLTAAILAAIPPAHAAPKPAERDAARIARATLDAWSREGSAVPATAADRRDGSDGRWFWLAVLALLALETLVRRGRPAPAAAAPQTDEVPRARVA